MTGPGLGRRGLIRLGFWGSAALAAGSSLALVSGCSPNERPAPGFRHLRPQDIKLFTPLIPIVLEGALPEREGVTQALHALDTAISPYSPGARKQVFQLLDLMHFGPARWYITGRWTDFSAQSPDELRQTLNDWSHRDSGFARLALRAVVQVQLMAWYGFPDAALSTGYPGPPRKIV